MFAKISAVLTAIIGILAGLLFIRSKQAADAKNKLEQAGEVIKTQDNIIGIVTEPHSPLKPPEKTNGIIKHLSILLILVGACACTQQTLCPKLYIINKPVFQDVAYSYEAGRGYIIDYDSFYELMRQMEWAKQAVSKYERQIAEYDIFLKGRR